MAYFPQRFPDSTVASAQGFATYTARMDWGTGVRGNFGAPSTQTTAAFTVPVLGGQVTLPVSASANFVAGDYVMVGTRAMTLTAPVHSSTGPGALSFAGRYFQGRTPGASLGPAGYNMIGQQGQQTTVTLTPFNLPAFTNVTSVSINVANRAQIPSGGIVHITNYAGVYRVVSVPNATSLLVEFVIPGDLASGLTCVQDISGSDTGAYVTQFFPLGRVPKGFILTHAHTGVTILSLSGIGSSPISPSISLGYVPNPYGGGPTTRLAEWYDAQVQNHSANVIVGSSYTLAGFEPATADERTCPMDGMAFGLRVNAPQGTSMVVDVSLRGLLVPMS